MRATKHCTCRLLVGPLLALVASAPVAAGARGSDPVSEVAAGAKEAILSENEDDRLARRRAARLTRLEERASAGEVSQMNGAVPILLDLAAEPGAPGERRRRAVEVLSRIAAGGDRSAARAERALDTLDEISTRASRPASPRGTEERRQAASLRHRLDVLMERIGDPRQAGRDRLAATLVLLASALPADESVVGRFAGWMKRDADPEVARWGEVLAARFDGRAPDPLLAPRVEPSQAELRRGEHLRKALFEQTFDADPVRRFEALYELVERSPGGNDGSDPELLAALGAAVDDADSRVSAYARFTLRGLAGDRHAFGMVYLGVRQ